MKIASIDIGTNTILLLIVEIKNNHLNIVEDHHKIARLGEGLDKSGEILVESIERASKILDYYKKRIELIGVDTTLVVATSAMRDAKNSELVKNIFESILDTQIKVIKGLDEARLSFLGSIENNGLNTVIDIGGGSTEIISGKNSDILNSVSLQTGAVRLSERHNLFYPFSSSSLKSADNELNFLFSDIKKFNIANIIAVAGTPNTLAQIYLNLKEYSREKLHNFTMTKDNLNEVLEIIKNNPKEYLINNYGVHSNRADIILGGGLILNKLLEVSNINSFTISANGLRFGVVKDYLLKMSN